MDIKQIKDFAEKEHGRLYGYYHFTDASQMNLPFTVKIMEELGELCNEVLAHSGLQRKEKMVRFDRESIAEEFADVILTTFILAHNMGIDLAQGIARKMQKIEGRYHDTKNSHGG